jgi:hypothetical protein
VWAWARINILGRIGSMKEEPPDAGDGGNKAG